MWTWLPFIGKALHSLIVARLEHERGELERRIQELAADRDYWKTRAEKLTDALLARAGAISEPVMVDRKSIAKDGAQSIFAGMSVNEIETGKQ